MLDPHIVGEEHYNVARGVQEILQKYKELQDIIAMLGMDELSEDDKLLYPVRERSRDSYHSRSSLRHSSQDLKDVMYRSVRLFRDSRRSSKENTMIFRKVTS